MALVGRVCAASWAPERPERVRLDVRHGHWSSTSQHNTTAEHVYIWVGLAVTSCKVSIRNQN
jgi:hypothetical protein